MIANRLVCWFFNAKIAQEIADEIQLRIGGHEQINSAEQFALSPKASEADQSYLKGRYFWNKRTKQGLQQAIEYFQAGDR